MPPKAKEDKLEIKQFKDGSSHFWVGGVHYYLDESNNLQFASGGIDNEESRTVIRDFIKRNKKVFKPREPSIFESEEKVYSVLNFGKYSGRRLDEVMDIDKQWLNWCYKNYSFKVGEEKLKQEIKELLKIKQMNFKCTCMNSGVSSLTGNCSNCGMQKYKTVHENAVNINPSPIADLKLQKAKILKLPNKKLIEELITEFYKTNYGTNYDEAFLGASIKGAEIITEWILKNN